MQAALELQAIIEEYTPLLENKSIFGLAEKPNPAKWSKKEIIGHLIDSAQNNLRRFIIAQYEARPTINYRQDDWVSMNNYQNQSAADLITLWALVNKQIVSVLKGTPAEKLQSICITGEPHTIEWLAVDYNKHLLHHLHQVLDMEEVAYP